MDALEAGGSSCHDCTLKYKVVVNKEALDVRKEKEAMEAKKQLVNQCKVVKSMKQNYENRALVRLLWNNVQEQKQA